MPQDKSRFAPPPELSNVGIRADPALAQAFRHEVADILRRSNNTSFPGAQPVSFARKHLDELKKRDYYVCEKSDGIRCLLYCTIDGAQEIHYLIDRKNDYYFIPGLHFPLPAMDAQGKPIDPDKHNWGEFHKQTLLDGELLVDIDSNGCEVMKYLVFDCLVMDGQDIMKRPLDKRLAYFLEKLYKPLSMLKKKFPEDASTFRFAVEQKSFQFAYGTEMLFKSILPSLKHGNDGLIFTCRETPYKFGTDEHILKWKPALENTIDFKLELTFPLWPEEDGDAGNVTTTNGWQYDFEAMPTFDLWVHIGEGRDERFATLHVTVAEWEQMKLHSLQQQDGLDGAIVECYKDNEHRWRFHRFRNDKKEANHITTVKKVLESIEDGVEEQELIDVAGEVRTAWKSRNNPETSRAAAS